MLLDEHKTQYQLGRVAMAVWLQPVKAPMRVEFMIVFWLIVTEGLFLSLNSPLNARALLEVYLKEGNSQFIMWMIYFKKSKKDKLFYNFLK